MSVKQSPYDYVVCTGEDVAELCLLVGRLIAAGYAPVGGVAVATRPTGSPYLMQAMYRAKGVQIVGMADSTDTPQPGSAPLTATYVQEVPDKCDRIVWRKQYYDLPLAANVQATLDLLAFGVTAAWAEEYLRVHALVNPLGDLTCGLRVSQRDEHCVALNGEFSADELLAIAYHLRKG